MEISDLPIFVWLVLQAVMLPASLLASPFLALLVACQAVITADVFAKGSEQTLLHALLWPFRLGAVAVVAVVAAALPLTGVWLAQQYFDSATAWSVILAVALVAIWVGGAAWILSAKGVWTYLPIWPRMRPSDIACGMVDSIADVAAVACLAFVVATLIRLPWLLRVANHNKTGVRWELFSQAAFAVVDVLLLPLVFALLCTGVRLPRLQQQCREQCGRDALGGERNVSCASIMNSWSVRAVVVKQGALLLFVDTVAFCLFAIVACSVYRLPALALDFKEVFDYERRRDLHLSVWSFLGKTIDTTRSTSSGLGQLEVAVLYQAVLILLDLVFLPVLLLVGVFFWRVPTCIYGVQAELQAEPAAPRVVAVEGGATVANTEVVGIAEALRRLDARAIMIRLVLLREALTAIFLDLPTFAAAALNVVLLYRLIALVADLSNVCSHDVDDEGHRVRNRYRSVTSVQHQQRVCVWSHVFLFLLDVVTVAGFLLVLCTMYRAPKTIRKLTGRENVWNRSGRHWSTFTLRLKVPQQDMVPDGRDWKSRPRLANLYILKRADKVLMDIVVAVPLMACALVPWKFPLILADLRLLLWYKTASEVGLTQLAASPATVDIQTNGNNASKTGGMRDQFVPSSAPEQRANKPVGCILGDQFTVKYKSSTAKAFLRSMHDPWWLGGIVAMITAFLLHWSVVKLHLAHIVPGDWCQSLVPTDLIPSTADSGSGSAAGMEESAAEVIVIGDGCMAAVLAAPLLILCCCCFCISHCCVHECYDPLGTEDLRDGMNKATRYHGLVQLAWCHFRLLPMDLVIEPICLVCLLVLKVTHWRYGPLERDAGTSLTIASWVLERPQRYKSTAWHLLQWLLDFPAVAMLVVLVVTVVRSRAVIMDLVHFSMPDHDTRAQRFYSRSQESYAKLRNGVMTVANDDEPSSVCNEKFPQDLTPALARSERRLAIAKLLHDRLTSTMNADVPFLPLELVESIAKNAVPVIRVPDDYLLAEEALAAAPPDATILLAQGVHRLPFEHKTLWRDSNFRYQSAQYGRPCVSQITIEGATERASDVIVIPVLRSEQGSMRSDIVRHRAREAVNGCPEGFLKNLTVVLEPAVVRQRSFTDETNVTEWRTLVWRNAALLILELPFPVLALLCLWRIPQLFRTLRAKNRIFDEYTRIHLTFKLIVQVVLDVPACIAIFLMIATGWRVPSLLRARANHVASRSPYRTIASEFFVWLCDLPFAALCAVMIPFVWRTPRLLKTLWCCGDNISTVKVDVWRDVVTPTQRALVMRCALLCLLDLLCVAALPLLVVCPWRGAQVLALAKYERMCSHLASYDQWQYFDTNRNHHINRPILSPLRSLFDYEASIIADHCRVHAVEFAGAQRREVVIWKEPEPQPEPEPEPEPEAEAMPEMLLDMPFQVQDGWIPPCESLTFSVLYCAYKAVCDLWRVIQLAFIVVLGFRHLPYVVRRLHATVTDFRTAGWFDRNIDWDDVVDDDVKLPFELLMCKVLCCLPCIFCWCIAYERHSYVTDIEESFWIGDLSYRTNAAPPPTIEYRYDSNVVLSVSPSLSMTMMHPTIDTAFFKAIWDLPHLFLLPIKLLVVVLFPSYVYITLRYKPKIMDTAMVMHGTPAIVSVFLLPFRFLAESNSSGLTIWNAHELGMVLLIATPFCVLDLLALLFMKVTCVLFAWPLTLLGPMWDSARSAADFEELGGLLPKGLISRRLHLAQDLMLMMQVLASPVLLLWVVVLGCGPLFFWIDTVGDFGVFENRLPFWSETVGSGAGSEHGSTDGGADSDSIIVRSITESGGNVVLSCLAVVFWLLVVVGGCVLGVLHCRRYFPLFNPGRAWVILFKKVKSGRLARLYQQLLVCPTVWSYSRRGPDACYIGEFVIPLVALVWAFWPTVAVALPLLVAGHCAPVSSGACTESMWGTFWLVLPNCLSLSLAMKCLTLLRRHWRQPLTDAERAELARPHLQLRQVRLQSPADGVGIIMQITAAKQPDFTAKKIQLQVLGDDETWEALGRPLSENARMMLPFVRRSLLPFDMSEYDCMKPSKQLKSGESEVTLEIRIACIGQPKATRTVAMTPLVADLARLWDGAPDLRVRLEHPTPLGWANTIEVSASPAAILQAMGGAPGEARDLGGGTSPDRGAVRGAGFPVH